MSIRCASARSIGMTIPITIIEIRANQPHPRVGLFGGIMVPYSTSVKSGIIVFVKLQRMIAYQNISTNDPSTLASNPSAPKSIITQSRLAAARLLKEHAATRPLPIRA